MRKVEKVLMFLALFTAFAGCVMSLKTGKGELSYRLMTFMWVGVAILKTYQIQKLEK